MVLGMPAIQVNRKLEGVCVAVLTGCYFVWLATAIIPSASENVRLVSVFSPDGATHVEVLGQALSEGTLRIDFSPYGHLPFNLALVPLLLMSFLAPVTDQSIIITLRLVSAVAGAATVLCTFFLARRYFGRLVGWVSACLLCGISLSFIEWSVVSHPDIPQLFFLMLGLYFCCRLGEDKSREFLVLASASAGLAFACKYSGLFLLPVIWLVAVGGNAGRDEVDPFRNDARQVRKWARGLTLAAGIGSVLLGLVMSAELVARLLTSDGAVESSNLPIIREFRILLGATGCALIVLGILRWPWRVVARSELLARTLSQVGISVAAFITAFVIGSPFSLWKLNFLYGMISQSRHVAFGHVFRGEGGVQGWLSLLVSQDFLGVTFAAMGAVGLLYLFHDLATKEGKPLSIGQRLAGQVIRPELILWLWVLLYLGFLVLRVRMFEPRYLLPVLPVLIILAVQFLAQLARASLEASSRKFAVPVLVLFLVLGAADFASSITRLREFRAAERVRVEESPAVRVGLWLAETFEANSRVLYDSYSYVPPAFAEAQLTFAGTREDLEIFAPDVVIVSEEISQRYVDPTKASQFGAGEAKYLEHLQYYRSLRDGSLGFTQIMNFGEVHLYANR